MNTEGGALYVGMETDNKQFIGAMNEAERRIKGFSDASVTAGDKVNKTLIEITKQSVKVTNAFKSESKREVGLIADLERELIKLKDKKRDAFSIEEISKFNKKIQEGEVHLKEYNQEGLKSVDQNTSQEKSQNNIITSLGKWAIGLATVTGAWKLFKTIMESTEKTADRFTEAMSGAKTGLDYFMKSIATAGEGGFTNFVKGLQDAITAGKDYARENSRISKIRNEYAIKEADLNKSIEEQRRIFYEDDKTAIVDKLKAADNMLSKMKEKADMEIEIAQMVYNNEVDLAKSKNKLSAEDTRYAIENYQRVSKIGEEYNKLNRYIEAYNRNVKIGLADNPEGSTYIDPYNTGAIKVNKASIDKLKEEMNALGPESAKMGAIFAGLERMTEHEQKAITDGVLAVKVAENQYLVESKRVFRMKENMQDQQASKEKDLLEEQFTLLTKAVSDSNTVEIKAITERIVVLQKELDVRTEIAKAALLAAYGGTVTPIKGLKAPTLSGTKPILPGLQAASAEAQKGADLGKDRQWNAEDIEHDKDAEDSLKRQLELRNQIVQAAASLVSQIGQQIGLNEKSMALLDAGLSAFTSLASGDLVGAAVSMLSGIIAQIPSAASRFEAQIEHINLLLIEQQRLIDQSEQKGGQADAREGGVSALQIKAAAEKKEYERLQKNADTHLDLLGWRQDKADEAYATWQATTDQIENSNQALTDFYTGTTASQIADSIMQGFQDGKTSAADFADTFNGFMLQAIENALKDALLIDLGPWYAQFAADRESGGVLTEEEIAALKVWYDDITAKAKADRQAMDKVTGIDSTGGTTANMGMVGTIQRSITEDTGTIWVGLARRQADDLRTMKDYSKIGVDRLMEISANTYGSWQELQKVNLEFQKSNLEFQKANIKLDTVISNTNPSYAVGP